MVASKLFLVVKSLSSNIMNRNIISYYILSFSLFFMVSISLLSLQNNDIKIPQRNVTAKLDLSHKFNIDVAIKKIANKSLLSN